MTNWQKFKITGKEIHEAFDSITFNLDRGVPYTYNGYFIMPCYIFCVDCHPFNTYQVGDYLEIDIEKTVNYSSRNNFNDTSIVRKFGSSTNVITTSGSSSDVVVSPSAVNYMKSQEARELAREMSRMVDDTGKEVEYKIEVQNKDGKKISHSLILRNQN